MIMENSMDNTFQFDPPEPLEGEGLPEGSGLFEAIEREDGLENLGMFEAVERDEDPESFGVFNTLAWEDAQESAGIPEGMEGAGIEAMEVAGYLPDPPLGISPPIGTLPPVTPVPPIGTLPPVRPVPPIGTLPPARPVPPIGTLPPVRPVPPIGTLPPVRPVPPIATLPRPPLPAPVPRPPVVIPPATSACPARYIRATVPFGWDFSNILIHYGVSFDALQNANPRVNLSALRAGQVLCVPPSGSRGLCTGNASTHIVERSENLGAIARRYRTTVAALLRANPNLAPQDFIPGRVICIPG